ncbi:MAG TPA: hypothetical protein PKM63_21130 [Panacibacter sp.]|nr:hypothetical protein [Panacibacter sp.]HNP46815.1 hypothetical protein [Panacibacter sp.]
MTDDIQSFTVEVEGKAYQVTAQDEKDQVLYAITGAAEVPFVIGLNEHAQWEATTDVPGELVQKIAARIEEKQL